jgi:hypothetical protein
MYAHGMARYDFPECGGETIYEAFPEGITRGLF